ncbi:DUF3077 domain-containing protein [Pseudomonas turukhanskensis]|uniref:DUF3077 domain-containing protein n=1 Tax=Pseudomonas turukhanskensis TaxID=1806536 RepID=A0A9W6K1M7_9PSED|nr:DUF3077 domain-containing protein [Pseudomonas turukhanskensis]GLK87841.1 hypothetical protein GCM10017655_09030 [Pseudomonas turukhanskensis]
MIETATAVTTRQRFDKMDTVALFSVNPGVPVEDALERAADLMLYVESISAADAFPNKATEAAIIQTLSQMAHALLKSTRPAANQEPRKATS